MLITSFICAHVDLRKMASFWSNVEQCPLDAIFGTLEAYTMDQRPVKVNLAIGTYVDMDDKPYVLEVVRKVTCRITPARADCNYPECACELTVTVYSPELLQDVCPCTTFATHSVRCTSWRRMRCPLYKLAAYRGLLNYRQYYVRDSGIPLV